MVVATGAQAVESSVRATTKTSVDTVWQKVGDFCGIAVWGGGIAHCELSADHKQRTLTLGNGAKVIEELVRWSDKHHSYTYRIVSSPLPVDHYESTLRVIPDKVGTGSVIIWQGKYKAKGASEADAKKIIDGIYNSGLAGLTGA